MATVEFRLFSAAVPTSLKLTLVPFLNGHVARHGKLPPRRHEELPPQWIAEGRANERTTNHGKPVVE
ncbi:MAG: hypothetical protein E5X74_17975 [Mesorhizobium sp.]|nr:MAG: hypothetical protein E5X74_17975 [Mesorhizobium sp.]